MSVDLLFFYACGFLAVFSAIAMVGFVRHIVASAMSLVVTMVSLAGIYLLLPASACGAIAGALIGLALLDGLAIRISMGAFAVTVDAPVMLTGLTGGLLVGLVGAIPPAVRCLRLPITEALKTQ